MKNRCLVLDASHALRIEIRDVPTPRRGEVLVRIHANGICGSDVHFFRDGKLGNFTVTTPYVPGHEASGVVVEAGEGVPGAMVGARVVIEPGIPCGTCPTCRSGRYNLCRKVHFLSAPPVDGTFCDYLAVDAGFVHRIPDSLSLEHAALAEPTAVAVHAVNRARFAPGATGVVLGAGPIGLLVLQAFKAAGGGCATCVDVVGSRLEKAREMGADAVVDFRDGADGLSDSADVVFETAGSAEATARLFDIARSGGCAVQVGWPKPTRVSMDIAALMEKEIDHVGINRYANAFAPAITWLSDGRIRAEGMISHRFDLDHAVEAFEFARDNPKATVKVLVLNERSDGT